VSLILVVDDESDVEMLFRQQFRRELQLRADHGRRERNFWMQRQDDLQQETIGLCRPCVRYIVS
jgi:hypothetical protein